MYQKQYQQGSCTAPSPHSTLRHFCSSNLELQEAPTVHDVLHHPHCFPSQLLPELTPAEQSSPAECYKSHLSLTTARKRSVELMLLAVLSKRAKSINTALAHTENRSRWFWLQVQLFRLAGPIAGPGGHTRQLLQPKAFLLPRTAVSCHTIIPKVTAIT